MNTPLIVFFLTIPPSPPVVLCGVPAREPVLLDATERGRSAGGPGGADGGLHRLSLHQPRAAPGHPRSVPAGASGHPAAGARLDRGGTFGTGWRSAVQPCIHTCRRLVRKHEGM